MSQKAADDFFGLTILWGLPPKSNTNWGPSPPPPNWYKQLQEKGYTTEELIRAAAENGYSEFTEEEYNDATRRRAHFQWWLLG